MASLSLKFKGGNTGATFEISGGVFGESYDRILLNILSTGSLLSTLLPGFVSGKFTLDFSLKLLVLNAFIDFSCSSFVKS